MNQAFRLGCRSPASVKEYICFQQCRTTAETHKSHLFRVLQGSEIQQTPEQIVLVPLAVSLDCPGLPCLPIPLLPCWMRSPERLLLLAVKSFRKKKKKWCRWPAEHFTSPAPQPWFSCCSLPVLLDYLFKAYTGVLMLGICWYLVMYRMQERNTSAFSNGLSPLGDFPFQLL